MMMSSTSMTSTSGVTLMSDLTPPLAPPRSIDIARSPNVERSGGSSKSSGCPPLDLPGLPDLPDFLRRLLDEIVDELRRGVVHLHVEVLDARRQVVVDPDRGNGDDQTKSCF